MLKIIKLVVTVLFISFISKTPVEASTYPPNLTKYQVNLLHTTFLIAKQVNQHPFTMQSILITESAIGKQRSYNNNGSYGIMQVGIAATYSVFDHFPNIKHKYFKHDSVINMSSIRKLLITNNDANIEIACYYFKELLDLSRGEVKIAVSKYNSGPYSNWYNVEYVHQIKYNHYLSTQYDTRYGIGDK